jgi:hypothetical protein
MVMILVTKTWMVDTGEKSALDFLADGDLSRADRLNECTKLEPKDPYG